MVDVAADMVIGGTRYVFAERLERAEKQIQAVRELCDRAEAQLERVNAPLRSDQRFTIPQVDVKSILRALDGA